MLSLKASAHLRRPYQQNQQPSRKTTRLQRNRLLWRINQWMSRTVLRDRRAPLRDRRLRDSSVRAAMESIPCGNVRNSCQCLSSSDIDSPLRIRFAFVALTSLVTQATASPKQLSATSKDTLIRNRTIACFTANATILQRRE